MAQEDVFRKFVAHCKEYGYVFPSSEIYDGLSAVYDYGQYGVELKNNIKKYWWDSMVLLNENVVGIDSAIFMHPTIWKASGHVDAFNDPLIDNRDSKKRYRADVLIEEHMAKIEDKITKEVEKAREKFGEAFDEKKFRETNQRVLANQAKLDEVNTRFAKALNESNLADLKQLIIDSEIVCPISGTRNWTDVRQFNLMFSTEMGSTSEGASKIYLRPETAQGIFVNFLNVQKTGRMKLPFGIAQIGKAFRNEITPGNYIFRTREFEQMEIEYFVREAEWEKWFTHWRDEMHSWMKDVGLDMGKVHDHEIPSDELAHYSKRTIDIEFEYPFGQKELYGLAYRTDFDLKSHYPDKAPYRDLDTNEEFYPHVIEPSLGVDRTVLAVLLSAYTEEGERMFLKLKPTIAPFKAAVFPLLSNKPELTNLAKNIYDKLSRKFHIAWDDRGNIGKRYYAQDEIGTPFCITVDFDSLEKGDVTVRDRDTAKQERVKIEELEGFLNIKIG
jgi:glycyl-tRNA synthetase